MKKPEFSSQVDTMYRIHVKNKKIHKKIRKNKKKLKKIEKKLKKK